MAQEPDDVLNSDDDSDIDAALDAADPVGADTAEGADADDTTDGGEAVDQDIEVVLAEEGEDDAGEEKDADTVEGGESEDTVEGAAGEEEELDAEAQGYSKSVQKRILRERRVARR